MKIVTFESKDQWLLARLGKITGTRLKDIVVKRGTEKKLGYYELIAERLAVSDADFDGYVPNETPMDRGTRLQKFAMTEFSRDTGKKVDQSLVLWERDDNSSIAISPDGTIEGEEAAIETKCLSSARHIQAYLMNAVPDEYEYQMLQYFIVNEKLQTLYFAFYDPRIPAKAFFYLTIQRESVQELVNMYLEYQKKTLAEVDAEVLKLSGF